MIEHWKVVEDFPAYEVSDLGRVKRIRAGSGAVVGRILRPKVDNDGYLQVCLHEGLGQKRCSKTVHRLVAKAFIPNPLGLPEVNHLGPKSDCRAIMLEWRSKAGHTLDAVQRGQMGKGYYFHKVAQKWCATYRHKHLGLFNTKEEAMEARHRAIVALQGVV